MTLEEYSQRFYRDTLRNIEKHGQSLVLVGGEGRNPGFVYTIGNAERGLPELLAVGVAAAAAMNALGAIMRERGRRFDDGEVVDVGGKCPVRVIDACPTVKRRFTIQAGRFLGTDEYEVQQVVVPDPQGRFPGERDCGEPWCHLPLYPRKPEGRLQ